jgi:hypothetical protein
LLASAAVCAFALHGRAEEADDTVHQLISATRERLGQFLDLPQIGCAALAVGSQLIATGHDGLELLALAHAARVRQDYPSGQWSRHHAAAVAVLGAGPVAAAMRRVAGMPRRRAAERILDLLAEQRPPNGPFVQPG